MGFRMSTLWSAPEVNPLNQKARTIPILNPINTYGRVFLFSWWGFMIAFWSWYAFPPLLTLTIRKDLHLSQIDIANSNIISLVATLLVRIVAGPACDRYGPRNTFATLLLLGSIPTFLAGTVTSARGLLTLRFFIGILGGSFVPCQVWSTGFFDKNVVGTANSLTAGWGNAGGGITYFVMPAIFDSLVGSRGLTPHVAWRVAFVVPGILIVVTAVAMVWCCPDTPVGRWGERHLVIQGDAPIARNPIQTPNPKSKSKSRTSSPNSISARDDEKAATGDEEAAISTTASPKSNDQNAPELETVRNEVIVSPTFSETMHVVFSPQTFTLATTYFCSFGAELSINSILGAYYLHNFPFLGQSGSGNWAAMFGLLNVVCRPFAGIMSDFIYRRLNRNENAGNGSSGSIRTSRGVWGKKIYLTTLSILCGIFQISIGLTNPHSKAKMMGLISGMAFFLEGANGANFSLVPHIHPYANGTVSGITGAMGNLGGVVFAIIFRYLGTDYGKTFWIIGVVTIGVNLALCWVNPIPRGQVGGR